MDEKTPSAAPKEEKTDIFEEILEDEGAKKAKRKIEEEIDSAIGSDKEEIESDFEGEEEEKIEAEKKPKKERKTREAKKETAEPVEKEKSKKEKKMNKKKIKSEETAEEEKPKDSDEEKKTDDTEGDNSKDNSEDEIDSNEDSKGEIESDEIPEDEFGKKREFNNDLVEDEIPEAIPKNDLKKIIIEKAMAVSQNEPETAFTGAEKLDFLKDESGKKVFIGRKKGIFKQYGFDAGLFLGRVKEKDFENSDVYLDSLNPHVVFVCGARGSGKSYVIGVVAEELAKKNRNVGLIVIDPIGVFWSMRYPNKEEGEIKKLREWGLKPEGLNNLKVFIPAGAVHNTPKSTFDESFSLKPSLLTGEDWCLTFGIERFSVTGLLLDKALEKADKGYAKADAKDEKGELIKGERIRGKGKDYSLEDIIECLSGDSEINSRDKGYKQDSVRALVSRFEAAKNWGIFSNKGTPLSKLSKPNQLTVLDTSFLEDNVTALVIGVLARRVLAARKILTRKEAAKKFRELDVEQLLELDIPPTWLFIDEAHTLIPSGNEKTPATSALVEYVKQGRRPGCSMVFATQQPSAIDTKVLSQLDIILVHKLIFDDDIKAVYKRTPTLIPNRYRKGSFIKTLPVGIALTGDRREETTRAFVLEVRPRMSQHEGRDAETSESIESMNKPQLKALALELILKDIESKEQMDLEKAQEVVDALNSKYRSDLELNEVLEALAKKGIIVNEDGLFSQKRINEIELDKARKEKEAELKARQLEAENEKELNKESMDEETEDESEPKGKLVAGFSKEEFDSIVKKTKEKDMESVSLPDLRCLPLKVKKEDAFKIASKLKKNSFLGIFGKSEKITNLALAYSTIYEIEFNSRNKAGEFILHKCFIDSRSGEFIHFKGNEFVYSNGLKQLSDLSADEINILRVLMEKGKAELDEIFDRTELKEERGKRLLSILYDKGFIGSIKDNGKGKQYFFLRKEMDLPSGPGISLLESIAKHPFVKAEVVQKEFENHSRDYAINALKKLWPSIVIKRADELFRPKWIITLSENGIERKLAIDGVTGKPVE